MTLNTIISSACRRLGLSHASVFNSDQYDKDLGRFVDDRRIDFLLYGNANYDYVKLLPPHPAFHIIRDPRDIVVSAYFSHLHSHPTAAWPELEAHRRTLESLTLEEGLAEEILFRGKSFGHMASWNYDLENVLEIRFEDFATRTYDTMLNIFAALGLLSDEPVTFGSRFRGITAEGLARFRKRTGFQLIRYREGNRIHASELLNLIWQHRFEARAKGRRKGHEDVKNHYRKGKSGDWHNYFTPELARLFKDTYPGLVPMLGYAESDDWE
jgi:hypothetical protein